MLIPPANPAQGVPASELFGSGFGPVRGSSAAAGSGGPGGRGRSRGSGGSVGLAVLCQAPYTNLALTNLRRDRRVRAGLRVTTKQLGPNRTPDEEPAAWMDRAAENDRLFRSPRLARRRDVVGIGEVVRR